MKIKNTFFEVIAFRENHYVGCIVIRKHKSPIEGLNVDFSLFVKIIVYPLFILLLVKQPT